MKMFIIDVSTSWYDLTVDDIPPVVTCGPDIVQTTPSSTGGRMVDFQECTAEDNSGVVNLISRSQNPGAFFPIGDTEVAYTFSDPNGNTASATFLITVVGGKYISCLE